MHLDNHTVDGELGSTASLTPAGNQLSPWSVRFNYPYLSLNNCKCYCWSHKLFRPLRTPSHFPYSVLSTDRETISFVTAAHPHFNPPVVQTVCDILKDPICCPPNSCLSATGKVRLSDCHQGKRRELTCIIYHLVAGRCWGREREERAWEPLI